VSDLLLYVGFGILGVALARPIIKKKPARLQAAGHVAVAIRLLDRRGIARRWRHGIVSSTAGVTSFRPASPRVGETLDLSGTTVTGSRQRRALERWWISGSTVIIGVSPLGKVEMAPSDGLGRSLLSGMLQAHEPS
jgi:predicted cobalt transporter CbtA